MSVGFRKSLFGFNREDVIEYIKNLHNNFSKKEADFKNQLAELDDAAKQLEFQKAELNSKMAEYEAKKAEIEQLSENIGNLYLVSQTDAKNIMSDAAESSKKAYEQIKRNVSAIEETCKAFENLKKSITEVSENYGNEFSSLLNTLEESEKKIPEDTVKRKKEDDDIVLL